MLELREIIAPQDIITANQWLVDWGQQPLDEDMYSTSGLVLHDSETKEDVFMGFCWFPSNCKMAQIGFIRRNIFYSNRKLAKQNKEAFIRELVLYCYQKGFNYVATWCENPILVNDFKKIGFTETSNKVSEFFIKLY